MNILPTNAEIQEAITEKLGNDEADYIIKTDGKWFSSDLFPVEFWGQVVNLFVEWCKLNAETYVKTQIEDHEWNMELYESLYDGIIHPENIDMASKIDASALVEEAMNWSTQGHIDGIEVYEVDEWIKNFHLEKFIDGLYELVEDLDEEEALEKASTIITWVDETYANNGNIGKWLLKWKIAGN